MKTLKINGQQKQFPDELPKTIADLLAHLKIQATTVVAEVDGQIIERENFTKTKLSNGQEIELIKFMGGG